MIVSIPSVHTPYTKRLHSKLVRNSYIYMYIVSATWLMQCAESKFSISYQLIWILLCHNIVYAWCHIIVSNSPHTLTQSSSDVAVGPGPIFECVRFSTLGRSPLLQHYLYIHNLSEVNVQTGYPISRTQVKDVPQSSITYKQLLQNSTDRSDQWYKAYERWA